MKASVLRDTYELFAATAEPARYSSPAQSGPEWPIEMVVAHVTGTTRTLVALGTHLLDGRAASYDGDALSAQPAWLEAIVRSTGTYAGLVSALRQSSAELLALADHFDAGAASRTCPCVIRDGRGNIEFKGSLTFAELLFMHVEPHVRNHTRALAATIQENSRG